MVKLFEYQLAGVLGGFIGFLYATLIKARWYDSFAFSISMILTFMVFNFLTIKKEVGK